MTEPEPQPEQEPEAIEGEIYPGQFAELRAIPPLLRTIGKQSNGRYVRDYKARERAIAGLRLMHDGKKWPEIAAALGYKYPENARAAVRRLLNKHEDPLASDYYHRRSERRLLQDAQLEEQIDRLRERLARSGPWIVDVKGQLVLGPDGEPMEDIAARAKVEDSLLRCQERRARLWGTDESKQARDDQIRADGTRQLGLALIAQLREAEKINAGGSPLAITSGANGYRPPAYGREPASDDD